MCGLTISARTSTSSAHRQDECTATHENCAHLCNENSRPECRHLILLKVLCVSFAEKLEKFHFSAEMSRN